MAPPEVGGAAAPEEDSGDDGDLVAAAAVLFEVFGVERFLDPRYLRWFYRDNPVGTAIEINRRIDGRPAGHLAGIPQIYHRRDEEMPFVFPLNVAVSERARGRGMMTEMSHACFDQMMARYGDPPMVGMPNAASTPAYVPRLGFHIVRPLPVLLCPAIWLATGPVWSRRADATLLEGSDWRDLMAQVDWSPGRHWSHKWTPDVLRWRLSAPGAAYTIHRGADLAVVTCVEQRSLGGRLHVPITVVLKILPLKTATRRSANGVIAAACRFHRSPFAVYAGFNARARVTGLPVPARLKPAPLNLVVRPPPPAHFDREAFAFDTFEFLEFDAF